MNLSPHDMVHQGNKTNLLWLKPPNKISTSKTTKTQLIGEISYHRN